MTKLVTSDWSSQNFENLVFNSKVGYIKNNQLSNLQTTSNFRLPENRLSGNIYKAKGHLDSTQYIIIYHLYGDRQTNKGASEQNKSFCSFEFY